MASTVAVLSPQSVALERDKAASVARPGYNVALGYLRGFLVVLVIAHHSVLAYIGGLPASPSLLAYPRLWRAFPVQDHVQSIGFAVFTGFNDDFFMSLMFLLSGLFVWSSLQRKGGYDFVRDRMRRLGIPFLVAAAVVAPVAYYPSYLMTGAHGVMAYIRVWLQFGDWPTGPAWFIWLLLAFDLVAGGLFLLVPNFGKSLTRYVSQGREHPVRCFLLLAGASAVVYVPMVALYGPMYWTSIGPFQVQTARLFHYALYFAAGIAIGAYGIDRGLLASDGTLARHWVRWTVWMVVAFALGIVVFLVVISKDPTGSSTELSAIGGIVYATICASISFCFMALFVRFATRRVWAFDSMSENEYGMYLIHYMFVSWLQLCLLSIALPALAKGTLVFGAALLLSWAASATLRRIPAVARIV